MVNCMPVALSLDWHSCNTIILERTTAETHRIQYIKQRVANNYIINTALQHERYLPCQTAVDVKAIE